MNQDISNNIVNLYPGIVAIKFRIFKSDRIFGCLSVLSNLQLRDLDLYASGDRDKMAFFVAMFLRSSSLTEVYDKSNTVSFDNSGKAVNTQPSTPVLLRLKHVKSFRFPNNWITVSLCILGKLGIFQI
jgi:hypothetical protein